MFQCVSLHSLIPPPRPQSHTSVRTGGAEHTHCTVPVSLQLYVRISNRHSSIHISQVYLRLRIFRHALDLPWSFWNVAEPAGSVAHGDVYQFGSLARLSLYLRSDTLTNVQCQFFTVRIVVRVRTLLVRRSCSVESDRDTYLSVACGLPRAQLCSHQHLRDGKERSWPGASEHERRGPEFARGAAPATCYAGIRIFPTCIKF